MFTDLEIVCTSCFLRSDDLNIPYSWVDLLIQSTQNIVSRSSFTSSAWNEHGPWPLFHSYPLTNDVKYSLFQSNILQALQYSAHYCPPNTTHESLGQTLLSFILVDEKSMLTVEMSLRQWLLSLTFVQYNSSSNSVG